MGNESVLIKEASDLVESLWLISVYGTSILGIFGIILNLFSIYILRRGHREALYYYLTTVLFWQTSALVCFFLDQFLVTEFSSTIVAFLRVPLRYISSVCIAARLWTTVAMTLDRFMALCYPFQHTAIATKSRAKKTIISLLFVALIFRIPELIQYTMAKFKDQTGYVYVLSLRNFKKYQFWIGAYDIIESAMVLVGPRVIVVILTTRIIVLLRKQFAERRSLMADSNGGGIQPEDRELERSTLLVLVKSGIGALIFGSLHVMDSMAVYMTLFSNSMNFYVHAVPDLLEIVSMSTNFFLFLIFGQTFRRTCKEVVLNSWSWMMALLSGKQTISFGTIE